MLKRITIENYKAFKNATTFELRPITVLLGKNSSGKSSICKLLSVLSYVLSDSSKGIFSMLNGEVKLGAMYSELFHTDIKSKLKFDLEFDNGRSMSLNYMMTAGDFFLQEYKICDGENVVEAEFRSKDDNNGKFFNLTKNLFFQEGGFDAEDFRYTVDYIGPVREQARRSLYAMTLDVAELTKVGYRGENTQAILLNSFLDGRELFEEVSEWYRTNMDGQTLDFVRNGEESGSFSLMVKRGKARVNLSDVGEGTNQVLPVITQSFMNGADITIIEQAGLHLHPSAHAHVAYRIAEAAKQTGKTYMVESHSENFVLGLRNMIAHKKLTPADVAIYYIDHDGESATAQLYEIEKDGSMSDWPSGVFAEDFELLKEISKAAR